MNSKWLSHPITQVLLWLVLPLVAGIVLSLQVPRPIIGIIDFRDVIYSDSARDLIAQFSYALDHPEVHAVVFILDSGGGTVGDTESVYLELIRLRQTKPVVTVVENMAASGAYYLASNTDYIFAQPSSRVGNIGVRAVLPSSPTVFEDDISTGPYKFYGDSRDSVLRSLDPLKKNFYQAVILGRGSALKATPDDLLSGKLYFGAEALRLGLIDALGTQSQAYDYAAGLANIWNYETKDLRELAGLPDSYSALFYLEAADGSIIPYPREAGVYYLYIPPSDRRLP